MAQENLTKQEAAELLGVSVRALQRYVQQGKISVIYIKTKQGDQALYNKEELEEFKNSRKGVTIRPAIENEQNNKENNSKKTNEKSLLSPINDNGLLEPLEKIQFLSTLETIGEALKKQTKLSELSHKKILTLDEAKSISGLSRNFLLQSIKSKKLKAKIIGKGWKIKQIDLDSFIAKI